jgi:GT2 family glycosyltransferase
MFTTSSWYRQLREAMVAEPRGSFTAVANRMRARWQVAPELSPQEKDSDDVAFHRRIGKQRAANRGLLDVTDTGGWGGLLMLVSKAAWQDAGGFADGLWCVDHMFHYALRAAGRRLYLIEGLYLYHFRASSSDRDMLRSAPRARDPQTGLGCPCRTAPHVAPTERRML